MTWEPITRTVQTVEGVDPDASGRLRISITLSAQPPKEWVRFFEHPVGVEMSLTMTPPRLSGSRVYIRPPDDQVVAYISHVDERIRAANSRYEVEALPKDEADAERAGADAAEAERRRIRAQRLLDEL